jgi:hypothetical protein
MSSSEILRKEMVPRMRGSVKDKSGCYSIGWGSRMFENATHGDHHTPHR